MAGSKKAVTWKLMKVQYANQFSKWKYIIVFNVVTKFLATMLIVALNQVWNWVHFLWFVTIHNKLND